MILDVLIAAAIVVFVWTRFTGHKLPKDLNPFQGTKAAKPKRRPTDAENAKNKVVEFPKAPLTEDENEPTALQNLRAADPSFRTADFLDGAQKAYQYYYAKQNEADLNALENLCAPQMVLNLEEAWAENAPTAITIKHIDQAEIADARLSGRTAIIDVSFTATQSEGNGKPKKVKSIWTFARPLDSEDPNWELEKISSLS